MNADDHRLTAYVLGELNEEEARVLDQLAETDRELAANLSDLRVAVAQIDAALAAEAASVAPDPRLSALGGPPRAHAQTQLAGGRWISRTATRVVAWWHGAGTLARSTAAAGAVALALLIVHDSAATARWGRYLIVPWLDSIMQDHDDIEQSAFEPGPAPEPPLVVNALRRLRPEPDPYAAAVAKLEAGAQLNAKEADLLGLRAYRGDADLDTSQSFELDNPGEPDADMTALWNQLAPPTPMAPAATGGNSASAPADSDGTAPVVDPMRRIIKDGTMMLETASVETAVGRLAAMAAAVGGYVAQTRWERQPEAIDSAEIVINVPAGDFEAVLVRAREVGTVLSEQVSSADVSQEYVDLQSEVSNLEATRARIREFLDKTSNVEEALRVNDELTRVESEIAQRKGRLQWLTQRSALSSLTVTVLERPPRATATPTPTATPVVTGLGLGPWDPSDSAQGAVRTVVVAYRVVATTLIWGGILAAAAAPFLAAIWLLRPAARQPLRASSFGSDRRRQGQLEPGRSPCSCFRP